MKDWITKLDGFMTLNDRAILTHAGKISPFPPLAEQRAIVSRVTSLLSTLDELEAQITSR